MAVKQNIYTQALEEVIATKIKSADAYVEEIMEPLGDVGNPERLMGAPYEEWKDNPQALQYLASIYGEQEPNPLSELIFRKEIQTVRALEVELGES